MTVLDDDAALDDAERAPDPAPAPAERAAWAWTSAPLLRSVLAVTGALVVFGALLAANGADPVSGYGAMWQSITRDADAAGDVLIRFVPYLLAALAVIVPARAGLFNIGGEGQLLIGAIGAMWVADRLGGAAPRGLTLVAMAVGGMIFGGAWASLAAGLRVVAGTNEAITSLLLNYLATLLMGWLVFGPWKDPGSTGFPQTRAYDAVERMPVLWGRVHSGVVIAVLAAVAVWAVLRSTSWGFRLGVLGANQEAARRVGFRTGALGISAMVVGGALAGLGGMLQTSGVEGQLRPGIMAGYGFTGVLAAWMVRQSPIRAIGSSLLLAAIAIGGNGLKIREGLSAASVNILMALVLLAVLGWGRRPTQGAVR